MGENKITIVNRISIKIVLGMCYFLLTVCMSCNKNDNYVHMSDGKKRWLRNFGQLIKVDLRRILEDQQNEKAT